jgi:hypothetical protein
LQELLLQPQPPPHPTKKELDEMKPGDKKVVKNVVYVKTQDEVVVLAMSNHHSGYNKKPILPTLVPSGPIVPMSSLSNASELPKISTTLPPMVRRHALLFEEPKVLVNARHAGNGTACHCHPTHFAPPRGCFQQRCLFEDSNGLQEL